SRELWVCLRPWGRASAPSFCSCSGEVSTLLNSTLKSTDVFVIGGGPAGLAAAIAARQQGFRVCVADGAQPPLDKACGEGLMPDGLPALEQLGIVVKPDDSHPFSGVRFLSLGLT